MKTNLDKEIRHWLYTRSRAELVKLAEDSEYWGSRKQIRNEVLISKKAAKYLYISISVDEALEEFFQRVMYHALIS